MSNVLFTNHLEISFSNGMVLLGIYVACVMMISLDIITTSHNSIHLENIDFTMQGHHG